MYQTAIVDEGKCIGCKICISACPEPNAIKLIVDKKKVVVIAARCKGCGICEIVCPKDAVTIQLPTRSERAVEQPVPCQSSR